MQKLLEQVSTCTSKQ